MADVVVRPYTEDDAAGLEAAVEASREHLTPFMAWASQPAQGLEWRRGWLRDAIAEEAAGGDRYRGFFDPATGEQVGAGGLHRRVGPRAWEIGYWVHAGHARRGIATAAVAQLVAEAFADPDVDAVEIHHDVANEASAGVARKAGFTEAGTVPRTAAAPADTGTDRRWVLRRPAGAAGDVADAG
jgi:ribosomal-protein-serine acetyltransferase